MYKMQINETSILQELYDESFYGKVKRVKNEFNDYVQAEWDRYKREGGELDIRHFIEEIN